jgi:hypothetical protein
MITLYLDMDGVIADFNKEYIKHDPAKADRTRFRDSVINHRIFTKLDPMPDAFELLNHVAKLHHKGLHVEMLTSMGTHDPFQGASAKEQKLEWLAKHNITYKPNFVCSKKEKAQYATPTSILIDDSVGCISPFIAAGGHGILHVNASDTISILDSTILQIRAAQEMNR